MTVYHDAFGQHRGRQWNDAADAIARAGTPAPPAPTFGGLTLRRLLAGHTGLRPVMIDGLLRRGEIVNLIGASKSHKTFAATDLGICVASGRPWLGRFAVERGRVLIVDNELHRETSADRIPRVAAARGVDLEEIADRLSVENLRGSLVNIEAMAGYFASIGHGVFDLVVLDALYRFLPEGISENDNGAMARVYNWIDHYAAMLGCSFLLVHHAAKGGQSGRAVTDVGAGAGAQSRAADTHLILRQHREPGVVVLDAAARNFPPLSPMCLRWAYPVFEPEPGLDPAALHRSERRQRAEGGQKRVDFTTEQFAARLLTTTPTLPEAIEIAAEKAGLSRKRCRDLLALAEESGLAFRHQAGPSDRVRYASVPSDARAAGGGRGVTLPPTPPRVRRGGTGVGGGGAPTPHPRRSPKKKGATP